VCVFLQGASFGFCRVRNAHRNRRVRRRPLWLRDMYKPLNATRKENMAQKLRDQDSSDEDETTDKDKG
uniref:Uncharacterized protein n=1 Tax=Rhinolophus ferrumequinum TaxID=59479 RepID=A0A671EP34_RHIFE